MPPDKFELFLSAFEDFRGEMRSDIRDVKRELGTLREAHTTTRETVAGLKVKAGFWGGLSGLVAAVGLGLIFILKGCA